MNLKWTRDSTRTGWLLRDLDIDDDGGNDNVVLHAAARGHHRETYIYNIQDATRYCVFGHCEYDEYCGDIPLTYSEEEVKAMAIALWRLSEHQE